MCVKNDLLQKQKKISLKSLKIKCLENVQEIKDEVSGEYRIIYNFELENLLSHWILLESLSVAGIG